MPDLVQSLRIAVTTEGAAQIDALSSSLDKVGTSASGAAATTNAALGPTLASVQSQITAVTAAADAMTDHMVAGGSVSTQSIRQLQTQYALLQKTMADSAVSASAIGPATATAMAEATAAVEAANAEWVAMKQSQIETNAEMNLMSGRARGLRGILIGMGASWAAEFLLVGVAAEQLYNSLGKFDDWLTKNVTQWQTWKETAYEAVVDVAQTIAGADFTRPVTATQSYQDLRGQPQGPKGSQTQFLLDVQSDMQANGITTLADYTAGFQKLQEQLALVQIAGGNVDKWIQDNAAAITTLAKGYQMWGAEIPALLDVTIGKLQAMKAAVIEADTNLASLKAADAVKNQASEIQQFVNGLVLKFQPPDTDPVVAAMNKVAQEMSSAQQEIDNKIRTTTQDIGIQRDEIAKLQAQKDQTLATGTQGPELEAQLKSYDALIDAAKAKIVQDQADVSTLKDARTQVDALGGSLEQLAGQEALDKIAQQTAKAFDDLQNHVSKALAEADASLQDLPPEFDVVGTTAGQKFSDAMAVELANVKNSFRAAGRDALAAFASNFSQQDVQASITALNVGLGALGGGALQLTPEQQRQQADAVTKLYADAWDAGKKAIVDGATQGGQVWEAAMKRSIQALDAAISSFADTFSNFAEAIGSGQTFGQAAGTLFSQYAKEGFKTLFTDLGQTITEGVSSGLQGPTQYGQTLDQSPEGVAYRNQQAAATLNQIQGYAAAAAAIYTQLSSGQTQGAQSFISDAVTNAAVGAQVGGVIGAVVGVVVAGIEQALLPSAVDKADIGQFNVSGGQAYFQGLHTPGEAAILQGQIQQQYDAFFDAYTKILLKFPEDVLPKIIVAFNSINVPGGGPGNVWDPRFGGKANQLSADQLANFNNDFQAWLTGTLPAAVEQAFKPALQTGFQAIGVTIDQFNKYWQEAQGLDPTQAAQFWSDMIDAITEFGDALTAMGNVTGTLNNSNPSSWNFTPNGTTRLPGMNDFDAAMAVTDQQAGQLATAIATLVGPEQMADAKQLSDLVTGAMTSLVNYLNLIGQISRSLLASTQQAQNSIAFDQLQRNPDGTLKSNANGQVSKAEADFYQQQLAVIEHEIQSGKDQFGNALNPQDIATLTNQGQQYIQDIYQLNPTAVMAAWGTQALATLNQQSQSALQQMGQEARTQVQELIDEVKPFVDYIKGDATSAQTDLTVATTEATGALQGFGFALTELSTYLAGGGQTPGGGGGFGPGPGTGGYTTPFFGGNGGKPGGNPGGNQTGPGANPEPPTATGYRTLAPSQSGSSDFAKQLAAAIAQAINSGNNPQLAAIEHAVQEAGLGNVVVNVPIDAPAPPLADRVRITRVAAAR